MTMEPAREIQITLESGKVLDFKESLGDHITVNEVRTYRGKRPETGEPVMYYTVLVTPSQGTEG